MQEEAAYEKAAAAAAKKEAAAAAKREKSIRKQEIKRQSSSEWAMQKGMAAKDAYDTANDVKDAATTAGEWLEWGFS